jgi:hypothetical protein
MGRTLPSITQVFLQEQASFARFRRALRRRDQRALDDLFAAAHQHLAAAAYASHALPFELFLLAMLLEEHKQTLRLQSRLEHLYRSSGMAGQWEEFGLAAGEPVPFAALRQLSELAWDEVTGDELVEAEIDGDPAEQDAGRDELAGNAGPPGQAEHG